MPGGILEDNVVVSAKSFVPKNSKLKKRQRICWYPCQENQISYINSFNLSFCGFTKPLFLIGKSVSNTSISAI